jgi:hypothetical protein
LESHWNFRVPQSSVEDCVEQELTGAGYSEVEILARERGLVAGEFAWIVTVVALGQDGKRYEVRIPMVETFGGWTAVIKFFCCHIGIPTNEIKIYCNFWV